jgi:hypothetical protein
VLWAAGLNRPVRGNLKLDAIMLGDRALPKYFVNCQYNYKYACAQTVLAQHDVRPERYHVPQLDNMKLKRALASEASRVLMATTYIYHVIAACFPQLPSLRYTT